MRKATDVVLVALTTLVILQGADRARGATVLLPFEGFQNGEQIRNYYNGGLGQFGSGPGPAFGITFSNNAAILNDEKHYTGEPTAPGVMLLGNVTDPGGRQISATMNVPGGFVTDLSFYYGLIDQTGFVQVYSGLNGTGTLLGSLALPMTPGSNPDPLASLAVFTTAPVHVPFSGTAQSAVFIAGNQQLVIDNIQANINVVPEPGSLTVLAEGCIGLLAVVAMISII